MTETPLQPMRYLICEKHLSLDNRFKITDESGMVHYNVNSTFFAMGDKLSIADANGNELIRIRQDNLHLHLTYKIFSIRSGNNEHQIATIKRTGPLWQHKLEIQSDIGEFIMRKKGGISSDEFILTKGDKIIAIVMKDASPTKILYWIDIIDNQEEDHAFVLAIVIVLACAQRLPGNPLAKPRMNGSIN
jgi:uncharacterized protein YxjI